MRRTLVSAPLGAALGLILTMGVAQAQAPAPPGKVTPRATPRATAGCIASLRDRISIANRDAAALIHARRCDAAVRKIRDVLRVTRRFRGCWGLRSVATMYLLWGACAVQRGRLMKATRLWRWALKIDPDVVLPAAASTKVLARHLARIKAGRQLEMPSELAPRARPRAEHPAAEPPASPTPPRGAASPVAFATRGVTELAGTIGISYQSTRPEGSPQTNTITVGPSLYVGHFVASHFSLGVYFTTTYVEQRTSGVAGPPSRAAELSLAAAPGFAASLGKRSFLFGDLLLGMGYVLIDNGVKLDGVVGVFGAELGIKIAIAHHYLLRLGLRPTYRLGRLTSELGGSASWSELRFDVILGFSGYL